jgi:hypothetical protein
MQQDMKMRMTHTWRLALLGCGLAASTAHAQPVAQAYPVAPGQRATAQQVAQSGVPLTDLAKDAPESYTVKAGDTLWGIAGLFLNSPWRWPELWGMNMSGIQDPNRIYPGQRLVLEKSGGRATLRAKAADAADGPPTETVRISPRTRYETLADSAIPTLAPQLIEPFLAEPIIVEEATLLAAPRIVGTQEGRVLLSRGDRAYARGDLSLAAGKPRDFRVFRNVTPLKDPVTAAVLGYEAQYVGKAELVRAPSVQESLGKDGKPQTDIVPATIDIVAAKEEMRVGDRLLPEPERDLRTYMPHAPIPRIDARVVSVYGSAVTYAAQNQVITINRGTQDGLERGHVLAIVKAGERLADRTDPDRVQIKLPDERNGLVMVFRTFDRLSYALVLQIIDGVKVGDRLVNPR